MERIRQRFSTLPEQRASGLVLLCLSALVLISFWGVLGADFVNFDDPDYVTQNFHVQQGVTWKSVQWAFQSGYAGNWHPLTWISHMVDCSFYGLKPSGHHFTNLLFHLGSTLLLFLALKQMTGALWRSAFVAALFGIHPMHVESVAWISERKDVLSGFFAMLTLWCYACYAKTRSGGVGAGKGRRDYFLALIFFALGLMSKSMLVTIPFVLLLLDFWPLGRFSVDNESQDVRTTLRRLRGLVFEKIPFFLLAIGASVATFLVQKHHGAVSTDSIAYRFTNAFKAYIAYVVKLFWPTKLAVFYPLPDKVDTFMGVCSLLLLLCWSLIVLRVARRRPFVFTGWFWFVGMLVPVIGFVQVGSQAMADRYSYLPSIGLFILVMWTVGSIGERWKSLMAVSSSVVLAACVVLTHQQVSFWKDSVSLFLRAFAVNPATDFSYNQLGAAENFQGRREDAIKHFERAAELNPKNAVVQLNWGMTLIEQGRNEEAIPHFGQAARLNKNEAQIYDNWGIALTKLERYTEAEKQFQGALGIEQDNPDVWSRLGLVLMEQKKFPEAEKAFRRSLQLNPRLQEAHVYLGFVYMNQGRLDEAVEEARAAVRLKPGDEQAQNNLRFLLSKQKEAREKVTPKP